MRISKWLRRVLLGAVLGLGLSGCYYYGGGYDVYSPPYYYPGYYSPYYYGGYYGPRNYGGGRYYYGGYGYRGGYGRGYHFMNHLYQVVTETHQIRKTLSDISSVAE